MFTVLCCIVLPTTMSLFHVHDVTDSQHEVRSSFPPELAARIGSSKKSLFDGDSAVTKPDYVNDLLSTEAKHAFASKEVKADAIHASIGSTLVGGDNEVIELVDDETQLESPQWQHRLSYLHAFGPVAGGNNGMVNDADVHNNAVSNGVNVVANVAAAVNIPLANDMIVSQTSYCVGSAKLSYIAVKQGDWCDEAVAGSLYLWIKMARLVVVVACLGMRHILVLVA
jgi:hypothetical protein